MQAHFVRVCEKLDHTSGLWKVTVMVADDNGCQLRVQLGDKVGNWFSLHPGIILQHVINNCRS